MAKLNAIGDVIMISADITPKEYETIQRHAPQALELRDDDGKTYFAIGMGDANVSKYGINFCSRNNDGNIFMTTGNVVVGDHSNAEAERAQIEDKYASILANLIKVEKQVDEALDKVRETVRSVSDAIHIEGAEVPVDDDENF